VWRAQIEAFLRDRLRLRLKDDQRLCRLTDGIDFLGYVVRPTHTLVRRRVVAHAHEALGAWERQHVRGRKLLAAEDDLRAIRAVAASYSGHFRHANSHRLRARFRRRYPWLRAVFHG
jgi:hypothetical protein